MKMWRQNLLKGVRNRKNIQFFFALLNMIHTNRLTLYILHSYKSISHLHTPQFLVQVHAREILGASTFYMEHVLHVLCKLLVSCKSSFWLSLSVLIHTPIFAWSLYLHAHTYPSIKVVGSSFMLEICFFPTIICLCSIIT